jgi:chorismate mutase
VSVTRTASDQSGLAPFRARLDVIDDELVRLLGERFQICREVAVHKSEREIPMMQPGRVDAVRARYLEGAAAVDLPLDFTGELFDLMIAATCRAEDELMDRLAARRGGEAGDPVPRDARDQVA